MKSLSEEVSGRERPSPRIPPPPPRVNASGSTRPRGPWATRAEVGRPVHEGDPPDRRAAAPARLALLAVGIQRAVEVARLPVDVDVEGVEGRATLGQRLPHH